MIDTVGFLGALLFFLKVFLHIWLMTKLKERYIRTILSPSSIGRLQLFFPFYRDVPRDLKFIKTAINTIYVIAVLLLIIFLIGKNINKF